MSRNGISRIIGFCVLASSSTFAHHAAVEFDRGRVVEVEGELISVLWRNPHIRFSIRSTDATGAESVWNIEGPGVSIVGRTDVDPDSFQVGQTIRVAGAPARNGANRLNITNALVSGTEYVLSARAAPRWLDTAEGTGHSLMAGGEASDDTTIFRVWSTDGDDPNSNTPGFWNDEYPLTEAAREAQARWVPLAGSDCEPKGMPTIMEQPYPIGFAREGTEIILRIEEYDTVRTIHLDGVDSGEGTPRTLLGYSSGHWDDTTLEVTTTNIDWAYFDKEGIPQGSAMRVVERFTPTPDGSRLNYSMTVTDPEVFTEPVTVGRHWVWRPGEEVRPYDCTSGN